MCVVLGQQLTRTRVDGREPVTAWRAFRELKGGYQSLFREPERRYQPKQEAQARVPTVNWFCSAPDWIISGVGFWGFWTKADALEYVRSHSGMCKVVLAKVKMRGKQVRYKKGLRAEYMTILKVEPLPKKK